MKSNWIKHIMLIGVNLCITFNAEAGTRSLFIYYTDGVEPLFISEIEQIRMTDVDRNGVKYGSPVVQEFITPDSIYRFHISEIEKVAFHLPKKERDNQYNKTIDLSGELAQYIDRVDYELSYDDRSSEGYGKIIFKPNTPVDLIPNTWDKIYLLKPTDAAPYGLVGEVGFNVDKENKSINWYPVDITYVFESLEYVNDFSAEGEVENVPSRASEMLPWYAAECNLPYSTVHKMTDELRDIPVGSEDPYVRCKIRMQPIVNCQTGVYIFPPKSEYDEPSCIWRQYSSVKVNVEASADGRFIVDGEKTGHTGDGIDIKNLPFGLGNSVAVKFTGSIKGQGSMGVKYDYRASYYASALTSAINESGRFYEAGSITTFKNKVVETPKHTLDASLSGKLTMTGTISLSVTGISDSLKAVTQTYTFGTVLSGDALYRTSELDEASTSPALYERITSSGVKATPVETLSASTKYGSLTIKDKSDAKPTGATTFYAVPIFGDPIYSQGNMTYPVSGKAMHSAKSLLGFAVSKSNEGLSYATTSYVWPGTQNFNFAPSFSQSDGDVVYPTATLQNRVILCSPSYPYNKSKLTPIITYNIAGGLRIVSGMPYFGQASNATTLIYLGTTPGWLKEKK